MQLNKKYKKGEPVISESGELLGQYLSNEKEFIVSNVGQIKKALLEMGNYAKAICNEQQTEFEIFAKRKIYNENIGSKEQYLTRKNNDLIWIEIPENAYQFIELE